MKQSRLPTNDQIDSILAHFSDHTLSNTDNLSPEGQRLVQDTADIFDTLRALVREKNADEVLQNFVWHTRDVSLDQAKKDPNEVLPVDGNKTKP